MEVKGHWSDHTEDIISALPEETDCETFWKFAVGTNFTSLLLNSSLILEYLNGKCTEEEYIFASNAPCICGFLGLYKCRITLLRHAEPNEPPKTLEEKTDAGLDFARFRSFGSTVCC